MKTFVSGRNVEASWLFMADSSVVCPILTGAGYILKNSDKAIVQRLGVSLSNERALPRRIPLGFGHRYVAAESSANRGAIERPILNCWTEFRSPFFVKDECGQSLSLAEVFA